MPWLSIRLLDGEAAPRDLLSRMLKVKDVIVPFGVGCEFFVVRCSTTEAFLDLFPVLEDKFRVDFFDEHAHATPSPPPAVQSRVKTPDASCVTRPSSSSSSCMEAVVSRYP